MASSSLQEKPKAPDAPPITRELFVFLDTGESQVPLTPEASVERQRAHLDNLTRLGNEKINLLAGPLAKHPKARGIVLMKVADRRRLAAEFEADPFVVEGYLSLRALPFERVVGKTHFPLEPYQLGEYVIVVVRRATKTGPKAAAEQMTALCQELQVKAPELIGLAGRLVPEAKQPSDVCGVMLLCHPKPVEVRGLLMKLEAAASGGLIVETYSQYMLKGIIDGSK